MSRSTDLDAQDCTQETHETLKYDAGAFLSSTDHVGVMADGCGGLIELRTCRLCQSTLSVRLSGDPLPEAPAPVGHDRRPIHIDVAHRWRLIVRLDGGAELARDDGCRVVLAALAERPLMLRRLARRLGVWLMRAGRAYAAEHPTRLAVYAAWRDVLQLLKKWEVSNART